MSADDRHFERVGGRTVFDGQIVTVVVDRFRYRDGTEVEREIVRHKGAAGVVAHDDTHLYLVRQPREAVGDPDFLEIPAGRLDKEGESPLEAAQRELAEEIGKAASRWERITSYVTSAGMSDEVVHVVHATGLSDHSVKSEEHERIEIVRWPLDDIDGALAATRDSKTIIGLQWLKLDRA
jgi:8-oxo-dGTP pyrophosphatase MutT (NUDIX family)